MQVVLFQPEIPGNTGNIYRLCVNVGAELHLIRPLGFSIDDKNLKRAKLYYKSNLPINTHDSFDEFLDYLDLSKTKNNLYAITKYGSEVYTQIKYTANDIFLFGKESTGLPEVVKNSKYIKKQLKIPMRDSGENNMSINLSNCVAIVVYEVNRQLSL